MNQTEPLDPEPVQEGLQLDGDTLLAEVAGALLRLPVALQVDGQAAVVGAERLERVVPLPPGVGHAVEEHHDGTVRGSCLDVVPAHAFAVAGSSCDAVGDGDVPELLLVAVGVEGAGRRLRQVDDELIDCGESGETLLQSRADPLRKRGVCALDRVALGRHGRSSLGVGD
ncbi:hypothetical protein M8Z33_00580 [Streptomyces sp. ZAF1911]|nr:hypothetical protein [Streptomyces sp. ZAF1911]MDD9375184.1 hypothetical protein [Streptomyces sp. ZAF1911]